MKKLLLVCISGLVLAACGDNYNSITIKELMNDKTIQEQEKIGKWLQGQLKASQLTTFGYLAADCSKQVKEMYGQLGKFGQLGQKHSGDFPEECNQTLGDFIKKNK